MKTTFEIKPWMSVLPLICSPFLATAQEDFGFPYDALSESFSVQHSHDGGLDSISFDQCTMIVQIRANHECQGDVFKNTSRASRWFIALDEVAAMEFRSFNETYSLFMEFDVPQPPSWQTQLDRLTLGRDEAFERFSERSRQLLAETPLSTRHEFEKCSGEVSVAPKTRSQNVFFNQRPDHWDDFEGLWRHCRSLQ